MWSEISCVLAQVWHSFLLSCFQTKLTKECCCPSNTDEFLFACILFDSRLFFSSLKFLVTEWGKVVWSKFSLSVFQRCQRGGLSELDIIDKSGQGRLADTTVGYQVDDPVIEGWSHFQERKVEYRASALIFVSLLRHKQFRWAWKKTLFWFNRNPNICDGSENTWRSFTCFFKEFEPCGNCCNIARRSVRFKSCLTAKLCKRGHFLVCRNLWQKSVLCGRIHRFSSGSRTSVCGR